MSVCLCVSDLNGVRICTYTGSSEHGAPQGVHPGERRALRSRETEWCWVSPGRAEGAGRIAKRVLTSTQLALCNPKNCACRNAGVAMWHLLTPGAHEHLNVEIYSEVQMLVWPMETQ